MNKTLGLILLTAGIAITAGFGSHLSPDFKEEMIKKGEAQFASTRAIKKHKAYCKSRKKTKMKAGEGCKNRKGRVIHLIKPKRLEGRSALKRNKMMLRALRKSTEGFSERVGKDRRSWIKALKQERQALKAVKALGTQGPGARLSGWAGLGGAGFGVGMLLVIAGSWICRVAIREELVDEGGDAEAAPMDFGVLLQDVLDRVRAIHEEMVANQAPTEADLDAIKAKLEDIQKGDLARLCESGPKVQHRYGLAGFAEIFSPLSAGERKLNRLWSTLVDRHWPEAMASASGAVKDLEAAAQAMENQAAQ